MEERRAILSKLQMVNIPDRMMALQSVISETLKVGAPPHPGCQQGNAAARPGLAAGPSSGRAAPRVSCGPLLLVAWWAGTLGSRRVASGALHGLPVG